MEDSTRTKWKYLILNHVAEHVTGTNDKKEADAYAKEDYYTVVDLTTGSHYHIDDQGTYHSAVIGANDEQL